MVRLVPNHSEILVSSLTKDEVTRRLELVTDQHIYATTDPMDLREDYFFNGTINSKKFRLSLKVEKADTFLPLIKGIIEPTLKGSIIFLDYSFFPATAFFLGFWGIITFLLFVFFLAFDQNWIYASISLCAGIFNYVFAFINFKRKVRQSQKIFKEMMDISIKG